MDKQEMSLMAKGAPLCPGRYHTYCEKWGYEINTWDGNRWRTSFKNPHGDKITHWKEIESPQIEKNMLTIPIPNGMIQSLKSPQVVKPPSVPELVLSPVPNSLSIVVTGRNDNYDGNFDERLIIALTHNISLLPEAEFIFVEWNPYLDRPLVCEKLRERFGGRVKYYVVHPKFHSKYCTIDGFLEYPPKNVGIRRAQGEFILSTNSDILISPETVGYMTAGNLEKGTFYRSLRIDIKMEYQSVRFPLDEKYVLEFNNGLTNACGDFLLMHRDDWLESGGYCEKFPEQRLHKDSLLVHQLVEVYEKPYKNLGTLAHWRHPSSWCNGTIRPQLGDIHWDYKCQCHIRNKETWGLTFAKEINKGGIVWLM